MNLVEAPFRTPIRVQGFVQVDEESRLVLSQLGLDEGEVIEKLHIAPLGDPISLKIGEQQFALRSEVCRKILVERV